MSVITIAAAKGYLLGEALDKLATVGYPFEAGFGSSRALSGYDQTNHIQLLKIRPWDVTEYVQHGAADLGIVGLDVLMEKRPDVLQLCDLKFGDCRLVVAGPADRKHDLLRHDVRVATKYPQSSLRYFHQRGLNASVIKLYGAIELAPTTGLSDVICDLTVTGQTLKDNQLVVMDTIFTSSAILIANHASMRLNYQAIMALAAGLSQTC